MNRKATNITRQCVTCQTQIHHRAIYDQLHKMFEHRRRNQKAQTTQTAVNFMCSNNNFNTCCSVCFYNNQRISETFNSIHHT
ncbi:hypothetical protein HanPI659440_Chr10g0383691 [Helianthus annuus]|nr:hypothetical protein HanPI659440_Chr10g0383691 [Helianthus annuus]